MVYAYPDAYTPDYQNYITLPYSVFPNPAITGKSYIMPGANRIPIPPRSYPEPSIRSFFPRGIYGFYF